MTVAAELLGADVATPPVGESTDPTCETCNAPLYYGGRGRRPRFCDEHKPTRTATSGTGKRGSAKLDDLEAQIAGMLASAGMMLQVVDPFDGNVFILRADAVAKQWRAAAEKSDAIRRTLERMLETSAVAAFISGAGLLVLPILSHHGVIPVPELVVAADVRKFTDEQRANTINAIKRAGAQPYRGTEPPAMNGAQSV